MKKNKYPILALLTLGWAYGNSQIEQVLAGSGQQLSSSNAQVSYTVGEPVISTLASSDNKVTQGYQQSNLVATAINEVAAPLYKITVFPNPAVNQLTVFIQGLNQQAVFKLYDINGKQVYEAITSAEKSQLDFSPYSPGQYVLQIADKQGTVLGRQQIIKSNN